MDPEDHAESLILRGYDDPRLDGLVTSITRWLTIPPLLFIAIRIGYKLQPETERKRLTCGSVKINWCSKGGVKDTLSSI